MSVVRLVRLHLKTSTFSYWDKSKKHFRKNMSVKIYIDTANLETFFQTDNTTRGYCSKF